MVPDSKWQEILGRCIRLADGCLIWQGAKTPKGYGIVGHESKLFYVHRIACERKHGPIDGVQACHSCDTPDCIEGEHLFPGTPAENSADMVRKGRSTRGEKSGNAVLTLAQVKEIRASNESLRLAALRYGVSPGAISHVRRRTTWAHV